MLLREALNAILSGKADDEAYKVAEAAGVEFISPSIWYKEKSMNAEQAKTILKEAKSNDTYEGPISGDSSKLISEAEELIEMAQQAWEQHARGPEVKSILDLAKSFTNGDEADDEDDEEPYDDPDLYEDDPDDVEDDEEYEDEEDEEEAPEQPKVESELAGVEPWEGYSTDRVPVIVESLEVAMEDDDAQELLAHVWAFETAHKNRKRILKRVEELAKQFDEEADEDEDEEDLEIEVEGSVEDEELVDEEEEEEEEKPKPKAKITRKQRQKAADEMADDSDEDEFLSDISKEIEKERLHVPNKLPEDRADVPDDFTSISDKDLQQLYMQFSAYVYRTNYLLLLQESGAAKCKAAVTELTQELLANADKYDEKKKEKTLTILNAEIAQDPEVIKWKERQQQYDGLAHFYKGERDGYKSFVESLSRLATMRQDEFEHSGSGSGGRKR